MNHSKVELWSRENMIIYEVAYDKNVPVLTHKWYKLHSIYFMKVIIVKDPWSEFQGDRPLSDPVISSDQGYKL